MMRFALSIALLMLTTTAAAAPQRGPSDSVNQASDAPKTTADSPVAPTGDRDEAHSAVAAQPRPAPQPPRATSRRRGSMVGYIEDSIVSSNVRVRFDSALHDFEPDRAEFFYGKCGCYRDLPATDPAFDPNAPGPRPGAASDVNFQQLYIRGEYAMNDHFSAFGDLPARWLRPQAFTPGTGGSFPDQSGLSDIRFGAKAAFKSTPEQVVTVRAQFFAPTGDAGKGLGTDHWSLEPALLYFQQLADRVFLESQVGIVFPLGGSAGVPTSSSDKFAGNVFFYGIGPSFEVYRGDHVRFAPVVELIGWHVVNGFQSVAEDASGINIANIKIGARTSWDPGNSFYVGWGHAMTSASWYENIVRFEYRYSF
jgi:hypothetical protein